MHNKPKVKSERKRRPGRTQIPSLGRAEVELELINAAAEKRVPSLSGKHMIATNLSGLDFTSEYLTEGGPFTANLLHTDFRNATLRMQLREGRSRIGKSNSVGDQSADYLFDLAECGLEAP